MLNSRNHTLGFADRTRKNLQHIEDAFKSNENVHVATQLANSLLGLIVLPWERRQFAQGMGALRLDELAEGGWPRWEITTGNCQTLNQLLRGLRNAIAHGRMIFSSDSRVLGEVTVEVSDVKRGATTPHWEAHINAQDLRTFCLKFIDLIEEWLG